MNTDDISEVLEANSELLEGFPNDVLEIALDIIVQRYRHGLDAENLYEILAFQLLEKGEADSPMREMLKDTPLKKLRSSSIALLGLFFPTYEVLGMARNPDYEPSAYPSLSPQDKTAVEIAKAMLIYTSGTEMLDMAADEDQDFRKSLYEPTIGKLAWSGLRSKEAAPKGAPKRKEETEVRNKWIIEWALELYEKHQGKHSAYAIAAIMHAKKDKWSKEGIDSDDVLSQYRIHSIIKKSLPSIRKTGK